MIELTPENIYCIKPLILTHSKECKVLICSDLHVNHAKEFLFKKRGYNSVQEHDAGMIERWNKKVSNNDLAFHLGDIRFGEGGEKALIELLNKLNFKELFIMPGNHFSSYKQLFKIAIDSEHLDEILQIKFPNVDKDGNCSAICSSMESSNHHIYYRISNNKIVHFIPNYFEIIVNKQPIVLSHYSLASFNGAGGGSWHCAGHSHRSLKINLGKHIDLSMENPLSPIDFDELREYMDKKEIIAFDHHSAFTSTPFSGPKT